MAAIRTAIIDGHPMFLAGLVRILGRARRFEIVATGSSPAEAIRIAEEASPDVMLIGFCMSVRAEMALHEIARRNPGVTLIMMTAGEIGTDLAPGADACVGKGVDGPTLVRVIEAVCRGEHPPSRVWH